MSAPVTPGGGAFGCGFAVVAAVVLVALPAAIVVAQVVMAVWP